MPEVEESNFVTWARDELQRAGLFDDDSDYDGMLGEAVMKLVKTHSDEGHSGMSASLAAVIFARLTEWKPLTPLTADPTEWQDVADMSGGEACWQSRRSPGCFSTDAGRTYYDIDEPRNWWRRIAKRVVPKRRWMKMHTAEPA